MQNKFSQQAQSTDRQLEDELLQAVQGGNVATPSPDGEKFKRPLESNTFVPLTWKPGDAF